MDFEQELANIAEQEARLRLTQINADTAWQLGNLLRYRALKDSLAIAFEVNIAGVRLFSCAMDQATPDNADWIRRKQNVVARFHRSSYALSLEMKNSGTTLQAKFGVNPADFVASGGSFPLRLKESSLVLGSLTVSGLPDWQDHQLAVSVLEEFLQKT